MLNLPGPIIEEAVRLCGEALPGKAFGIIAGRSGYGAEEVYPLFTNLRARCPCVDRLFESYGRFYEEKDSGFWVRPKEQIRVMERMKEKGQDILAVYHSHRKTGPLPSPPDIDLHYSPGVFLMIVSLKNPLSPEVRVFQVMDKGFSEVGFLSP